MSDQRRRRWSDVVQMLYKIVILNSHKSWWIFHIPQLSLFKCVNGKPECKCTYHVDMWFTELTILTLLYILYIIYIYIYITMTNKSAMTWNHVNKTSIYLSYYSFLSTFVQVNSYICLPLSCLWNTIILENRHRTYQKLVWNITIFIWEISTILIAILAQNYNNMYCLVCKDSLLQGYLYSVL